jgi:hypothetical protein
LKYLFGGAAPKEPKSSSSASEALGSGPSPPSSASGSSSSSSAAGAPAAVGVEHADNKAPLFVDAEEEAEAEDGVDAWDDAEEAAPDGANVLEESHMGRIKLRWGPNGRQYAYNLGTGESVALPRLRDGLYWALDFEADEEDPTRWRAYVGPMDREEQVRYDKEDAPESIYLGELFKNFAASKVGSRLDSNL